MILLTNSSKCSTKKQVMTADGLCISAKENQKKMETLLLNYLCCCMRINFRVFQMHMHHITVSVYVKLQHGQRRTSSALVNDITEQQRLLVFFSSPILKQEEQGDKMIEVVIPKLPLLDKNVRHGRYSVDKTHHICVLTDNMNSQ